MTDPCGYTVRVYNETMNLANNTPVGTAQTEIGGFVSLARSDYYARLVSDLGTDAPMISRAEVLETLRAMGWECSQIFDVSLGIRHSYNADAVCAFLSSFPAFLSIGN